MRFMLGYAEVKRDTWEAAPMNVTVRIHTPHGLLNKKCKTNKVGKIKGLGTKSDGTTKWKPDLVWYETKHGLLGRQSHFTDIFPDAEKTWSLDYSALTINRPELTQKDVTDLAKKKVFERRYGTEPKGPTSTGFIFLAIISIIGFIVIGLLVTRRLII